jgi:hypothetical protein
VDLDRELGHIFRRPPRFVFLEPGVVAREDPDPKFFRIVNEQLRCYYDAPQRIADGLFLFRKIDPTPKRPGCGGLAS